LAVAISGIAISFLLYWLLTVREQQLAKMEFVGDSESRVKAVQQVISDRLNAIRTLAAFFDVSESVDRKEFHDFIQSLFGKHPDVQCLGWSPRVSSVQRPAYEKRMRGEGFAKFQFTERTDRGGMVSAGRRTEYYPVVFVEPFEKNESLFGFDLFSNPVYRDAMRRATLFGPPAAAACSPNGAASRHILLFVTAPVRDEAVHSKRRPDEPSAAGSFLFGIFRIETIVQAAIDEFSDIGIDISIAAPSAVGGENLIYTWPSAARSLETSSGPDATLPAGKLHFSETLRVGDSRWTIYCTPVESYLTRHRSWGAVAMLLAGLLVTGLLLAYLFLLTGRTVRVEQLVAERTWELRESEQRYRSAINNAGDGLFLCDSLGETILDVNQRVCDYLGYSREELLAMRIADVDVEFAPKNLVRLFNRPNEEYPIAFESVHRRKDGATFPVESRITPVSVGGQRLILALARDVTDRKRTEEALRNDRRLLRDMLDLQEQDRKLVAYEIHDGLAQQLTGAIFKFQSIEHLRDPDPAAAQQMFDEAVRLLREAMAETRRLISGLRPPILDESGVVAAVEYLISEYRRSGGPAVDFFHPAELPRMAAPLESAVFRTVQECLTNASRYSQSEKIRVDLQKNGDRVCIDVQDWGVGFDPAQIGGGHYGLQGIRERARLFGGVAAVESSPGHGTRVHVEFPLLPSPENGAAAG
jgi:PAS domain S-box-containing protein